MNDYPSWDFFYDEQIRRYLLQFMRIFSLIKVQSAPDENGTVTEKNVPIRYGDSSRMVEMIRRNNSENTIIPSTMMSVWIADLKPAEERRHFPYHTSQINIDERKFVDGEYTDEVGHRYSIERYMPSPYLLTLQLDIWTYNTTTKLQILEQIMTIFNPGVQIQQNDNMLDWTTMYDVNLKNINWTNRTIGSQVESDRDIASLTFETYIWINPPSKVSRKKLIEQIVTNVYAVSDLSEAELDRYALDPIKNCFDLLEQIITTPGNHKVKIGTEEAGPTQLMLLRENGEVDPDLSWEELLTQYGEFQSGATFITLKTDSDIESSDGDIIGFVDFDPNNSNILIFTVDQDTLPSTIPSGPIDQIVNPLNVWPGEGLPAAATGQRYLITDNIPDNTGLNPWGNVRGRENDIIEFNGTSWFISFDASQESADQYVRSLNSYQHYRYTHAGWVHTYFGEYNPGYWRITMQKC